MARSCRSVNLWEEYLKWKESPEGRTPSEGPV
jgi:hypothetical protein